MSHQHTMPWSGRRRPTLGLLTANLHLGVASTLWSGIARAAQRHDLNLVCFPGDELTSASPRHAVYELVGPRRLDALICWSSALGLPAEGTVARRLLDSLEQLPAVSLNRAVGGHQTLALDSYQGMCEAVAHLVEIHGRRRLAFLQGPTANPVTAERYRAYAETLGRYHIPLDPRLVSSPTEFRLDAGTLAFQVLLDVRGIRPGADFDGLVACSDFLAADALHLLTERGVRIPEAVAVTGFNDSPEASATDPPLTSVSMPFDRLGERAVEYLAARLRGLPEPELSSIPTPLVVRRSCGCMVTSTISYSPSRQHNELIARNLRALGTTLITTTDVESLAKTLSERLPSVGVLRCYVALYGRPGETMPNAKLAFVCDESGLHFPDLRPFPVTLLVPDEVLGPARRHQLVVEPLHVGAEHFGYAVFEAGPGAASVVRAVGDQISAALKGIGLYGEVLRARDLAERADRVKTSLLTAVSDELRTPLQAILRRTADARKATSIGDVLEEIEVSAEHQLAVINDLLDLSGLEVDALDLEPEFLNPGELLDDLFRRLTARDRRDVDRFLDLPPRLPLVRADPERLQQALSNVFLAADRLTPAGTLTLSARVRPTRLAVSFTCSGSTIPAGTADDIFEPFVVSRFGTGHRTGLALAVARRVVAMHGGAVGLERDAGGDVFTISLPFPTPEQRAIPPAVPDGRHLIVVGAGLPEQISATLGAERLEQVAVQAGQDPDALLAGLEPAAMVWDAQAPDRAERALVRRLVEHPRLRDKPILWYEPAATTASGFPSAPRPRGHDLASALHAVYPGNALSTVGLVDHEPPRRERLRSVLRRQRPDISVLAEENAASFSVLEHEGLDALVLAHALPVTNAFDILDQIRCQARLHDTFVLVLLSDVLAAADLRRSEPHGRLVLAGYDILSAGEILDLLDRGRNGEDQVPSHTGMSLRRAIACLHQHYRKPLTRRQVAQVAGISEDYLSRMFHRQYGIGPWEYLNRLRIRQAKTRLLNTDESIQLIARKVGFRDRAYFSRTFRRLTGHSPQAFRAAGTSPPE